MADVKITELPEISDPVSGDIVPLVDITGVVTDHIELGNIPKGAVPTFDDSSLGTASWKEFQTLLYRSVNSGVVFSAGVVSTYSLAYTVANAYVGGVLAPNGDIHFVPLNATVGQKIYVPSGISFSKGTCLSPFLNKF